MIPTSGAAATTAANRAWWKHPHVAIIITFVFICCEVVLQRDSGAFTVFDGYYLDKYYYKFNYYYIYNKIRY